MATSGCTFGMATGATFTAVVLVIPLNGFADIDNAQARVTGAFHLSHGSHEGFPFIDTMDSMHEQLFILKL